jgi:hypothetical protein
MLVTKLRERAPKGLVNCWEYHLSHDHPRSKIVLHYLPPRPNTSPRVVVVHKSYG